MKKSKLLIIVSISLIIILGISLAYFTGTIENIGGSLSINSGKVTFTISETRVNANNLVPIYTADYEEEAYKHTFTITRDNDSTLDACYELNLVIDSIGTNLRNQYLHYRLEYDEVSTEGTFNGKTNGDTITLITNQTSNSANTTKTYTLYIWLEYSDSVDQTSILAGNASSRTLTSHLEISGGIDSCISEEIPLTAYKYNNQDTDISYSTLYNALGTEYDASVTCTNGSVYTYSNGVLTLDTLVVPDRCTIYFTDKTYEVDITCNNCTSSPSTDTVLYNESPTFTITPDSAYTLEGATVNCSNNQSGSINESTGVVTVSNVTNSTTCTISPVLNQFTVTGSAVGSGTVTSSTSIIYGSTATLTVTPDSGYYLSTGSCTNDYTITYETNPGIDASEEQAVIINNNDQKNDSTCTFTFSPLTRSFTVNKTGTSTGVVTIGYTNVSGNSTSTTGSSADVYLGSDVTLTFSNNSYYYVQSISGCTTSSTTSNSDNVSLATITIANITNNTTCTVNYAYRYQWRTYSGTYGSVCSSRQIVSGCPDMPQGYSYATWGNTWCGSSACTSAGGTASACSYGSGKQQNYLTSSCSGTPVTMCTTCSYFTPSSKITVYYKTNAWRCSATSNRVYSFTNNTYGTYTSSSSCNASTFYVREN